MAFSFRRPVSSWNDWKKNGWRLFAPALPPSFGLNGLLVRFWNREDVSAFQTKLNFIH
jgi:hypothetical protein